MREIEIKPLKLTKSEVDKYFKMLCNQLDDAIDYIIFRKLNKNVAYYVESYNNKIKYIELDPRGAILTSLIHELSHAAFPEMDENEVLTIERSLVNRLTIRQYRTLWKKAFPKNL